MRPCSPSIAALALFACLPAVGAAWGQEQAAPEPPARDDSLKFQDQVVVTAAKTEQKLLDLPVQATILTSEDVSHSAAQTVADILTQQVPSFNLQRAGSTRTATPATTAISLRAMGSGSASRALVLLDGIPLNDPFFGWIPWSRVPRASIERIEVVPAGGAGAWGNQALGGVINILTRRPEHSSFDLDARVGGLGTRELDLGGSRAQGPFTFTPRLDYFTTDGYITLPESVRGPIDTPSASDSYVLDGRMDYKHSPTRRFTLEGSYLDDDRTTGRPLSRDHIDVTAVRAGGDIVTSDRGSVHFDAFSQWRGAWSTRGSVNDERTAEVPNRDQFDIPSSSLGAGLSWSKPVSRRHLLSAGTDMIRTEGRVYDDSRYVAGAFTRRNVTGGKQVLWGAYVQDAASLGTRWRATLGGRLDLWHPFGGFDRLDDLATGESLRDAPSPTRNKWIFNPNLGLNFRATDRLGLRGSVYRTFRAPTPNELYKPAQVGSRSLNQSNPNLDPERVTLGFETGFDYSVSRTFSGRASGFWNEINDSIIDVTVGINGPVAAVIGPCGLLPARGTCREKQNLDRVRNRGVELGFQWRPDRLLRFTTSYIYASSTATRSPNQPDLEGKRLRRVPEHQATARAEYANPGLLTVSLQGRYLGDRFQDDQNLLPIADSVVLDLFLSKRLTRRLELYAIGENVLGTDFEIDNGSDGPEYGNPRILHGGVRFAWSGRGAASPAP
jgi:outer membrane receptor protein involved in Fe transport